MLQNNSESRKSKVAPSSEYSDSNCNTLQEMKL